jgi:hypothetical protein
MMEQITRKIIGFGIGYPVNRGIFLPKNPFQVSGRTVYQIVFMSYCLTGRGIGIQKQPFSERAPVQEGPDRLLKESADGQALTFYGRGRSLWR